MIRILVVDDDSLVRDLMRDYIREHMKDTCPDYEVVAVTNGSEAVEVLDTRTERDDAAPGFDLIFLDVRMPGMSGVDVYNWIADNRPALKKRVCFVTGYIGDLDPYIDPSEVDLLRKPFLLEDMIDRLERHIHVA